MTWLSFAYKFAYPVSLMYLVDTSVADFYQLFWVSWIGFAFFPLKNHIRVLLHAPINRLRPTPLTDEVCPWRACSLVSVVFPKRLADVRIRTRLTPLSRNPRLLAPFDDARVGR